MQAMEGLIQARRSSRIGGTRQPRRAGTVTLISGCMFSGKTTELLHRVDAPARNGERRTVRAFKHRIDHRYSQNAIVTHDGQALAATTINQANDIPVPANGRGTIVALDEAHFFDDALVDIVEALRKRGSSVIMTSLDRSSWGQPFPLVERLAALADELVVKVCACQACGGEATHTQRLTPIVNGDLVGGPDRYEARCEACWTPPPETAPVVCP